MSLIRPCRKCGQRISLRKMPHGRWVAFEVASGDVHQCFRSKARQSYSEVSGSHEEVPTSPPTTADIEAIFAKAIAQGKYVDIKYQSADAHGRLKEAEWRRIAPFGIEGQYCRAYCELRHDGRTFRFDRVLGIRGTEISHDRVAPESFGEEFAEEVARWGRPKSWRWRGMRRRPFDSGVGSRPSNYPPNRFQTTTQTPYGTQRRPSSSDGSGCGCLVIFVCIVLASMLKSCH